MKKYLIIALCVLLGVVVLLGALLGKMSKENKRLKNNLDIELKQELNTQQTITTKELKQYFNEEVETLKKYNIKPSQVENIIKVSYVYKDTLTSIDTLIYVYDTVRKTNIAGFEIEKNCHTVSGCVSENNIEINSIETSDTLLISLYKEKRKCLFKQRKIKAIAISKCSGDTLGILRNLKVE
jgi:ABC-type transport system involved in Fe-S cluster assembly fused permease/ATPase subunit